MRASNLSNPPLPPLKEVPDSNNLYQTFPIESEKGMPETQEDDPLIMENQNLEKKITKLTDKNKKLDEKYATLSQQYEELKANHQRISDDLKAKDSEINELKKKNKEMNSELTKSRQKLQKMPVNAEKTQQENLKLKSQIEDLNREIRKQNSMIQESSRMFTSQSNQKHETDTDKQILKQKFEKSKKKLKELKIKLKESQDETMRNLRDDPNIDLLINNIKAEKDQIIEQLRQQILQLQENENNKKAEEEKTEPHEEMKGIQDTPDAKDDRDWARAERKEKRDTLFNEFRDMKSKEKEIQSSIDDLQQDILIEERASSIQLPGDMPKALKPKTEESSEKVENEEENPLILQLKSQIAEKQKELNDLLNEESNLIEEMIQVGIKKSSFDNPDRPYEEEEDESDFTFAELANRLQRIRGKRKAALEELKKVQEENAQLIDEKLKKQSSIDKITEIINRCISQRIITPK